MVFWNHSSSLTVFIKREKDVRTSDIGALDCSCVARLEMGSAEWILPPLGEHIFAGMTFYLSQACASNSNRFEGHNSLSIATCIQEAT